MIISQDKVSTFFLEKTNGHKSEVGYPHDYPKQEAWNL